MSVDHTQTEDRPRTRDALLGETISLLTEAGRLTRVILDRDQGRREEPADWAEFVSEALAGAAANLGGIETALAGRPGSWEADFTRQLLTGTVGHDGEYLWEHRTEPVTVTLYVDELVDDVDARKSYDDAESTIDARHDEVPDGTDAYERHVDLLRGVADRLEEQRIADWTTWGKALAEAVKAAAARRLPGLRVPVVVVVDVETWRGDRQEPYWPDLEWELTGEALGVTPAPWLDGPSPLDRIDAARATD